MNDLWLRYNKGRLVVERADEIVPLSYDALYYISQEHLPGIIFEDELLTITTSSVKLVYRAGDGKLTKV